MNEFLELKDVSIDPYCVVAYNRYTIPGTLQTPEMPAITIWLASVHEPIVATYVNEDERNKDYESLKEAVKKSR